MIMTNKFHLFYLFSVVLFYCYAILFLFPSVLLCPVLSRVKNTVYTGRAGHASIRFFSIDDLNLYMCTVCTVLKCVHVCMCVHVCLRVRACVCDDDAVAVAAADEDDIKISQTNDCFIIKPSPSS